MAWGLAGRFRWYEPPGWAGCDPLGTWVRAQPGHVFQDLPLAPSTRPKHLEAQGGGAAPAVRIEGLGAGTPDISRPRQSEVPRPQQVPDH